MSAQDRENTGQFVPGHSIRPTREQLYKPSANRKAYRDQLSAVISTEDFAVLARKVFDDALNGSGPTAREARKLLFNHLLGRPPQAVNVSSKVDIAATLVDALANAKTINGSADVVDSDGENDG